MQGVPEPDQPALGESGDPGRERLQPQPLDVDARADRAVGRVEQLEAPVDQEAVDLVGADPPADVVLRLEHHDVASGGGEVTGAAQPGQACADHQHVGVVRAHRATTRAVRST